MYVNPTKQVGFICSTELVGSISKTKLSWQGFGNVPRGTLIMVGRCQLKFESPVRVKHIIIILIC
jgi:hypothetical protein